MKNKLVSCRFIIIDILVKIERLVNEKFNICSLMTHDRPINCNKYEFTYVEIN